MKAIIYCRVSTIEQAETGYSLEAQEKSCRSYAHKMGFDVAKVFIERGESAKTADRTELNKLITYVTKNAKEIDALLVYKLDRLSRDVADFADLFRLLYSLHIDVKSATENIDETPNGKLLKNILTSFAQFENDVRAERTTSGMKQAVRQGRWCWQTPMGYRPSRDHLGKPLIVPSEQCDLVKEAFTMAESGIYSQTEIVKKLYSKGLKISNQTLFKTLTNPLYAGLIKVKWFPDFIDGLHEPIISKATYFKVQQYMNGDKAAVIPKLRNHPDFPLRNFIRCPKCDKKLTGSWSSGKTKKYPYYHCPTRGCSLNVRREIVEESFYNYLKNIQPREDILNLFENIVLDVWREKKETRYKDENRIKGDLGKLEVKKERLIDLVVKGVMTDETYKEQISEVEMELLNKKNELTAVNGELTDIEPCLSYCKGILTNIAELWAGATLDLKQRFQNLIFPGKVYIQGGIVRTPELSLVFNYLQSPVALKSNMVALRGIEPRFDG